MASFICAEYQDLVPRKAGTVCTRETEAVFPLAHTRWVLLELIQWPGLEVTHPCLTLCLQTYIGSILASVNPYQPIAGLYEPATMEQYSRRHLGELPPHIFAIANECYRCLWKRHDNQCILIR